MSLLDKASLIVTPNAYKESKLYSVVPNTTLGDMDVVRATTATRVNSAGLIEVVPRNLLTYSEQFDNGAWQKLGSTISFNSIVSPDGANNADKIIEDISTGVHRISQQPTAAISTYTFSVYAKAGERNIVQLRDGSSAVGVWFNLSNGTVGTQNIGVVGSIQNAGNGWYKCTATRTTITSNVVWAVSIADIDGNQSYTGNGVSGLFIWGAQLEQGSTATEYFPTTTRLNIPRIDYTNGSCPSLLVEPQRTNLLLRSEEFENASWTKSNINVLIGTGLTSEGLPFRILTNTANGFNILTQTPPLVINSFYSFTIVVKKGTARLVGFRIGNGTWGDAKYDFDTDTFIGSEANLATRKFLGDGWIEIKYQNFQALQNNVRVFIGNSPTGNALDGIVNETLLISRIQVELGTNATSYIPTVASTVTRNADVISKTGISSLIGQTEGTFFTHLNFKNSNLGAKYISINDGTNNNRISFILQGNGSTLISEMSVNGTTLVNVGLKNLSNFNLFLKIAVKYKSGEIKYFIDGQLVFSSTSTYSNAVFNRLLLTNPTGGQAFDGDIKSIQLYKTALTDTEMTQLTTL